MKFDMSSLHTIFESANKLTADIKDSSSIFEKDNAKYEDTLNGTDVSSLFDKADPITEEVFMAMKNAAADPSNLKITMVRSNKSKLFIEAAEFALFCEASNLNVGDAAEKIMDACEKECPEMKNAEMHVVFPSDSLNKNIIGDENLGKAVRDSWAMQLMSGCRRYGLKVNVGVENKDCKEC